MVAQAVGSHSKCHAKNTSLNLQTERNYKERGAAIGVSIVEDVTSLFIIWWDKKLKEWLEENNVRIEIYSKQILLPNR